MSNNTNKLDAFFEKRQDAIFYLSLLFFVLLSLLSFDAKLSTGGDDASYIVRAMRLIKFGKFPTFQGPLYPIFLSPFVALFGIKVNLLKLLSVLLGIGFMSFFYKSLKGRINATVLSISVLFIAFNSYLIYYASQTYSEMFHLFMQALFMYFMFGFFDQYYPNETIIKRDYKQWILIGFLTLLVVLSKNIGLALVIGVVVFFVFQKKFISAGIFTGLFAVFYFGFRSVRDLIWETESPFSRQGAVFLYKDPYNYGKGKEELSGFLNRFYENIHIYLSKNFMKIMNLRESDVSTRVEIISYIIILLLIFGFYRAIKNKNKEVNFMTWFVAATLGVTFVTLQTRWDSDRLIILVVPYLILLLVYALYEIIQASGKRMLGIGMVIVLGLLLFSNISKSFQKVDLLAMKKNLKGDRYYGYTPDWVNYLKMSEWVSDNLPENDLVGVRKQTMSIIFSGGRNFHSIGRVPSNDPDSLLNLLKDREVKYVVMASLRRNPKKKSEYTVNTVARYLSTIEQKYPGTFRQIHQIGSSEPARLFLIQYPR